MKSTQGTHDINLKGIFMKSACAVLASAVLAGASLAASFTVHELDVAHQSADEALHHLAEANAHHHDQFGGHEGRATDLLIQAKHEIEQADRYFQEHQH